MRRTLLITFCKILLVFIVLSSCKKDDPEPVKQEKTTGIITGKITDQSNNSALKDARILVYNANNNAPTGAVAVSDVNGNYKFTLDPGNYYFKISRQGFQPVPLTDAGILPFAINKGDSTTKDYQLTALNNAASLGFISGKVIAGGNGLGGALVVAENGTEGYSAVSGGDGSYVIFNVPAGNWKTNGWKQNYNGTEKQVSVTSGQEATNQDITMTEGGTGSVSGKITFLSTGNIEVDVSLVHPVTKETIPGLGAQTVGALYQISGVPKGTYFGRASYVNDTKVMDPDWILKFGQPGISVNGNAATLDFSVTGALSLASPTNDLNSVKPVDVSANPTFTWVTYSSANGYVIEVVNSRGQVVWGGITGTGNSAVRNVYVPKTTLSVNYNFDNKATETLKPGEIYRWRVYASKDENTTLGWKLITASEEQVGLIKVTQ
jgi:hypothetical protein